MIGLILGNIMVVLGYSVLLKVNCPLSKDIMG